MLGQTLADKYVLERLLGEGGMGAVYQAKNNATGRRVAVKVITADDAQKSTVTKRFAIEARAAGAVESIYIAQVLDAGEDTQRNIPFIVMEYLVGEDLDQLLTRLGALPQALVVKLGAQVCLGLAKAHAAGVVHRDVKPANIFVAERDGGERGVKLLDFGVAKVKMEVAQQDANLTRSGSLVGSPLYMSPEQARGKPGINHATDLWSLGIVLYQALSGRSPHDECTGLADLVLAICSDPARSVQTVAPWVSSEFASIITRALMIDPLARFSSADEMYAALRSLSPESIAISDAELVSVSQEERRRAAAPATGPWIPTGEEFPREEVTLVRRPVDIRPPPDAAAIAAMVHLENEPTALAQVFTGLTATGIESEPTVRAPTLPLLVTTGSDLPTVVKPNELLLESRARPSPPEHPAPTPPQDALPAPLSPAPSVAPQQSAVRSAPAREPAWLLIVLGLMIGGIIAAAAWVLIRR